MTGLHDPARECLEPLIAKLGYAGKVLAATDLTTFGSESPMIIWVTTDYGNDRGIVRAIADKLARKHGVTVTSKKGGGRKIGFVHAFAPGQRKFDIEEVQEAIDCLMAARNGLEKAVKKIVKLACR